MLRIPRSEILQNITYNQYLEGVKNQLKPHNSIITMLVITTWSCYNSVLPTIALALVYSVTKYCAPEWAKSAYCPKVDVQLNHTMYNVQGTVTITQSIWLPTLSNIAFSDPRRLSHTTNIQHKIESQPTLPLQIDILEHPLLGLKFRALIQRAESRK